MKKIRITDTSEIGRRCLNWAKSKYGNKFLFVEKDSYNVDVLFSIFHNKIFSSKELKKYKLKYNFHGGPLPEYRGSGSPIWCIINGEKITSITVHEIVEKLDAGDVYLSKNIEISEHDTGETLYNKLTELVFSIFCENFIKFVNKKIVPVKQSKKTTIRNYTREDLIKAKNLTNIVRAFNHSKKENAYFYNKYGKKIELKYD